MGTSMAWLALVSAGLLDVAWALAVKQADSYTRPGWTRLSLILLAAFVYLLGRAMQVLPLGRAYVVWSSIGAAGTVLLGILIFREPVTPMRITALALIIGDVVMLRSPPTA
jgi:quaternary ammonium compound-resistance protein SugE